MNTSLKEMKLYIKIQRYIIIYFFINPCKHYENENKYRWRDLMFIEGGGHQSEIQETGGRTSRAES